MEKTLCILVTCCVEQSRQDVLEKVVQSLKDEQARTGVNIEDDLLVFDNGSSLSSTHELLDSAFNKNLYKSPENLGYWSALNWIFEEYAKRNLGDLNKRDYEYVYIIESDHFHYAIDKLDQAEAALNKYAHLGSVRLQEYSVNERHLYNKNMPVANARRYAWVSHVNAITNQSVKLSPLGSGTDVYESNFLTCLHSMNRLNTMLKVFKQLSQLKSFSERDFQRMYHDDYKTIGQLDGGVFHAKLGFTPDNPRALSGSWSKNVTDVGYRTTRIDRIQEYNSVQKVK